MYAASDNLEIKTMSVVRFGASRAPPLSDVLLYQNIDSAFRRESAADMKSVLARWPKLFVDKKTL